VIPNTRRGQVVQATAERSTIEYIPPGASRSKTGELTWPYPGPATAQGHAMKAMVQVRFGAPDVLELRQIDQPQVGDDEVLVQVHAASVNPADWYAMAGVPYIARLQTGLRKPKARLGIDLAGVVVAVGGNVARFKAGEEVFGGLRAARGRRRASPRVRGEPACASQRPRARAEGADRILRGFLCMSRE
jgi:threonine dehydrogenase-like Zn-dependent dehydrogenase